MNKVVRTDGEDQCNGYGQHVQSQIHGEADSTFLRQFGTVRGKQVRIRTCTVGLLSTGTGVTQELRRIAR